MKILIDNGHGSDTPGKRSPDGRFLEYLFNREIATRIVNALKAEGFDAELLVPELYDVPLKEHLTCTNPAAIDFVGNRGTFFQFFAVRDEESSDDSGE